MLPRTIGFGTPHRGRDWEGVAALLRFLEGGRVRGGTDVTGTLEYAMGVMWEEEDGCGGENLAVGTCCW